MLKSVLSLICLVLLCTTAALASDVIVLTDATFDQKMQEPIILIEFYAPWCGHCKALAPKYEEAATILKSNDPPIPLAKVDCTVETKTCSAQGVGGYPTLKIFKNGVAEDFKGQRETDAIVKIMKSKAGPASKELSTGDSIKQFIEGSTPVVVGFFTDSDSEQMKTFLTAASALSEDIKFAHTTEQSALTAFSANNDIILFYPPHMHNKFEDKFSKYSGSGSSGDVQNWIRDIAYGLAGVRDGGSMKFFDKKPLVIAYYNVDYEKNPKGTNYWRNRLIKVGKKFIDDGKTLYMAISSTKDMSHELGEFGIESPDDDKVYITLKDKDDKKYKMETEFNMENFEKFLTDYFNGAFKPYLKSEPVPTPNNEPVKVVVARTFNEIVNDQSKDVLIEFYAPWCGHCKSLAPIYDELAGKLKDETDIVIAKMDATANDVPSNYQVSGFPTLYFASKNNKQNPEQYTGGRDLKSFLAFLAKKATNGLKGFDTSGEEIKSDL